MHKKHKIENELPSVFVDVSKKSILGTIDCFPKIFNWNEGNIIKSKNSAEYFQKPLIDYFDNDIDSSVKNRLEIILKGEEKTNQ